MLPLLFLDSSDVLIRHLANGKLHYHAGPLVYPAPPIICLTSDDTSDASSLAALRCRRLTSASPAHWMGTTLPGHALAAVGISYQNPSAGHTIDLCQKVPFNLEEPKV